MAYYWDTIICGVVNTNLVHYWNIFIFGGVIRNLPHYWTTFISVGLSETWSITELHLVDVGYQKLDSLLTYISFAVRKFGPLLYYIHFVVIIRNMAHCRITFISVRLSETWSITELHLFAVSCQKLGPLRNYINFAVRKFGPLLNYIHFVVRKVGPLLYYMHLM